MFSLLRADMVGQEAEVAIWWDEGKNSLSFPTLEPHTGVEADIIQESRVLQNERCQVQRNEMERKGMRYMG